MHLLTLKFPRNITGSWEKNGDVTLYEQVISSFRVNSLKGH